MANCINCGAELNENSKFCPECGTPVEVREAAPSEKAGDGEEIFYEEGPVKSGDKLTVDISDIPDDDMILPEPEEDEDIFGGDPPDDLIAEDDDEFPELDGIDDIHSEFTDPDDIPEPDDDDILLSDDDITDMPDIDEELSKMEQVRENAADKDSDDASGQTEETVPNAEEENAPAPRKKMNAVLIVILAIVIVGGAAAFILSSPPDVSDGRGSYMVVTTTEETEEQTETEPEETAVTEETETVSETAETTQTETEAVTSEPAETETEPAETEVQAEKRTADELAGDGIVIEPEHKLAGDGETSVEMSLKQNGIYADIFSGSELIIAEFSSEQSDFNGSPVVMILHFDGSDAEVASSSAADNMVIFEYANIIQAVTDSGFSPEDMDNISFNASNAEVDVYSVTFMAG